MLTRLLNKPESVSVGTACYTPLSMDIWRTIESIIRFVEVEDGQSSETQFLTLLDKLVWQISEITPTDPPVGEEIPENDFPAIRKAVEKTFPEWGYYNVAGSITENVGASEEVHVGDAIDDVSDIVNDLKMVLWSYQHESEEMAIWHLLYSYKMHWRGHLRSLQFYVHCLETSQ